MNYKDKGILSTEDYAEMNFWKILDIFKQLSWPYPFISSVFGTHVALTTTTPVIGNLPSLAA